MAHEIHVELTVKLAGPALVVEHEPEGWQAVQRMWRKSFTEWQGAQGYELQIPVVFDHWADQTTIEDRIRQFERLGEKMDNQPRTPIVTFDSDGTIPHDKTRDPHRLWVVQTYAWSGDYVTMQDSTDRVRDNCTITLWEYDPDTLTQKKERIPRRKVPKHYIIKKGDTLQKIAAFYYHDQSKWHDIAQLNNIRDPHHLKVGRRIKLPQHLDPVATGKNN